MICAQFGQVAHCEVLVDRTGRSFGEAEIEFTQKSAALECINKLDNEVADGKLFDRERGRQFIDIYII